MYYIVQLFMEKKSSVCTLGILQKVEIYGKASERGIQRLKHFPKDTGSMSYWVDLIDSQLIYLKVV